MAKVGSPDAGDRDDAEQVDPPTSGKLGVSPGSGLVRMKWEMTMTIKRDGGIRKTSGYLVDDQDRVLCPGVICRCNDVKFCPMHGKCRMIKVNELTVKRIRAGLYSIRLPDSRTHQIENVSSDVQNRPGMRQTWIVRDEQGKVYDASETLRGALERVS